MGPLVVVDSQGVPDADPALEVSQGLELAIKGLPGSHPAVVLTSPDGVLENRQVDLSLFSGIDLHSSYAFFVGIKKCISQAVGDDSGLLRVIAHDADLLVNVLGEAGNFFVGHDG